MRPRSLSTSLLLTCLVPALAAAQSAGSARVSLRLLTAITVTGTQDLDFGTIASTQVRTVAPKNGGRFTIQGTGNTPVLVQFTQLPASLGPNLALSSWTGLAGSSPGSGSATAIVPLPGGSLVVTLAGNGRYFLWLGATLSAASAAAGVYSVPVVVTVIYN